MWQTTFLWITIILALVPCACSEESRGEDGASDTDVDADTDSDADTDADSDADSDTDADSDGDTDTAEESIEVVITADNAYGFGYGTDTALANYYGGIENMLAGEIFNCSGGPETYDIPPEAAIDATYLYIIGYADSAVTQGVLGQFRRVGGVGGFGDLIYTGDPAFEVCATGQNYSPGSGGPDLPTINAAIVECNDGDSMDPGTTSMGWVDWVGTSYGALAVGEDNTTPYDGGPTIGNEFPIVCSDLMDANAHWMWFNWDPDNIVWPAQSPFMWPGGTNPDHQFLLFRLAAEDLPPIVE